MRPSNNQENKTLSDTYWKVEPAASMYEISGPKFFRNTTEIVVALKMIVLSILVVFLAKNSWQIVIEVFP